MVTLLGFEIRVGFVKVIKDYLLSTTFVSRDGSVPSVVVPAVPATAMVVVHLSVAGFFALRLASSGHLPLPGGAFLDERALALPCGHFLLRLTAGASPTLADAAGRRFGYPLLGVAVGIGLFLGRLHGEMDVFLGGVAPFMEVLRRTGLVVAEVVVAVALDQEHGDGGQNLTNNNYTRTKKTSCWLKKWHLNFMCT